MYNGINLYCVFKNSKLLNGEFSGNTKTEFFKNSVPSPINKSLKTNPKKIVPINRIIKGVNINQDISWLFLIIVLKLLGFVKKTKKINLIEYKVVKKLPKQLNV